MSQEGLQELNKSHFEDLISIHKDEIDYLEIRLEQKVRDTITYNESGLKDMNSSQILGGCVRACHKGGWGFFSFTDLDQVKSCLLQAIEVAKLVGESKTQLASVPSVKEEVRNPVIKSAFDVPVDEKLALLQSYKDRMMSYKDDRLKACRVLFSQDIHQKYFFNSEGSSIKQEFLAMDLTLTAIAMEDGVQTPMIRVLNNTKDFDYFYNKEELCDEVCSQAVEFCSARNLSGGEYTVILDPIMAGTLAHESFGHTSEADLFASSPGGRETLKIGRKFGKSCLSIYDTGDQWNYSGSMKYDDEGVATRKVELLKEGVLAGRLHTRSTAAQFGEEVTGNARSVGYQFPPIVRMRNTCIAPGKQTFEELLSGTSKGIYCFGIYGGHGGENFSFIPAGGYRIENGKLGEPVKNFSISGNLFDTLETIDGVTCAEDFSTMAASGENGGCGKGEQFPLPVGMSAPRVRIQRIQVGGMA